MIASDLPSELPPDRAAATSADRRAAASDPGVTGTGDDLDLRLTAAVERAGHALRVMVAAKAYAGGLSPIQLNLLLHLTGGSARRRTTDLAAEFDVSVATVSDALGALRRKGLVDQQPDPVDRRSRQVAPTQAGRDLAGQLTGWAQPTVAYLRGVDVGAKTQALRFLLDLIAHLRELGVISVARTCLTCVFYEPDAHEGTSAPHHCRLLDTAFADDRLRVDCAEHQPAAA